MAKKKYYVVWKGRKPGVYNSWAACEQQVKGYRGASFRSFPTKDEAEQAYSQTHREDVNSLSNEVYIEESISVDAGSHGNPGFVEYKGVCTKTGEILFSHPGFKMGTNNMGEFLAIVHALAFCKKGNSEKPIYTDSGTAINWVKKKKANSSLKRTPETEEIWNTVERAEKWLKENEWKNPILKWNTKDWGEIKADYGRK
ncbi:ribonuclease HI [Alteribacillus persepolensis]|uniref:Ribonuclease H n=1 Tax=Alteribacillus persepolensis TaxID=568899 RepID=A0A1G8C9X1_9BACI|nr:ribonuclease H family protein [Alteribacillus persepolensis]SDH42274.1 ribonuclease HI [Alteribacillus persepolensis]